MRADIKTHVSNCKTCFVNSPAKTEAQHPGLAIPLEDLSSMDWLSCDLCEIKDKKGSKQDYLVIVDRYSSFVRAYKLGSTKTKNVIKSLEDFIETYYGPPLLLTTDGGPQFGRANKAIKEWAIQAGINHELSSAYHPQSNGEAEQAVKRVKTAIRHSDGTPAGIASVCHTLNWEQRADGSGTPAEMFMNRTPRYPGLPTIPHKIIDNSDMKLKREESRRKQVEKMNKGLRRPEIFKPGDEVYLRDQENKWKIPAKVVNQRKHAGFDTPSYLLKNLNTGTLTCRNERDIRKFAGDEDTATENADETPVTINKVSLSIMKTNKSANSNADTAESSEPDRRSESGTQDIREGGGHSTTVSDNPLKKEVHWAKAIEVINFEEKSIRSTFSLQRCFALRPKRDEPLASNKEAILKEECSKATD